MLKQNTHYLDTEKAALIHAEQTKLLFNAIPLSVVATIINALILVMVQWPVIDHSSLLLWFYSLLMVLALRLLLTRFYKRSKDPVASSYFWARWFNVGVLITGVLWSSCTFWLLPYVDIGHKVFLLFILAGMCAGATTSLSFQRVSILTFLFVILTPLAIMLFWLDDPLAQPMGALTAMFLIMVSVSSTRIFNNTEQNIALRIESYERERALQQSEEKYRLIFDAAPLGVVHYDNKGKVTGFNANFLNLIGVSAAMLDGLSLTKDINDDTLKQIITKSLEGRSEQFDGLSTAFIGHNDAHIRVFCSGIKTRDGEVSSGVAIVEDITEDKRVEGMKNEFVSTVSHELRTPLTAIRGAIGLLKGEIDDELSSDVKKLINIAYSNTERLLLLINDILDIDKIESGEMSFDIQELDVMELLEEAMRVTEIYAREHKVGYKIIHRVDRVRIKGDHDRLMQVMYNLLSNASKFSPENTTVEIGAQVINDAVKITVTDHGPGISKDFQSVIFDRFTQYDASDSRRVGGTGLGLSISKALVEKHGGRIGFDTSDQGTTFYVEIPMAA